ncbi:hypothetical protein MMC21_006023 [Puttea exsequens]|nr:hypothetical protein [Puttea exsequens]
MALDTNINLLDRLAQSLSQACLFNIHHLSTPPTQCPAIFAAPPGEEAEQTYCESHFLSTSIDHQGHQLQVFAIEVLIYTTKRLTTLFVSKADSTGYLHSLNLPRGTPSPVRIISTIFLQYLIEKRQRPDRRLILSLFARAQNQYLFPGSVENSHKHVLDDRGLIKWWCKVINPMLGKYQNIPEILTGGKGDAAKDEYGIKSHAYLRVPGCDTHETRSFLPKSAGQGLGEDHRWSTTDPLKELGKYPDLPERSIIPRFPDDPKARFVDTLDDEVSDDILLPTASEMIHDPSKRQKAGRWRSIRSLEGFWEMMQFRQECSSGRLVGFIWAVFQPADSCGRTQTVAINDASYDSAQKASPTPDVSQQQDLILPPPQSPLKSDVLKYAVPVATKTPPMSPSKDSSGPTPIRTKEATISALPEETQYYYWPKSSRGEIVLRAKDYKRVGDQLLRMDYANEDIAAQSTRKWINDITDRAGVGQWGRNVRGTKVCEIQDKVNGSAVPLTLGAGLMRKKKRPVEEAIREAIAQENGNATLAVNALPAGLVRKKPKMLYRPEPARLSPASASGSKAEPG